MLTAQSWPQTIGSRASVLLAALALAFFALGCSGGGGSQPAAQGNVDPDDTPVESSEPTLEAADDGDGASGEPAEATPSAPAIRDAALEAYLLAALQVEAETSLPHADVIAAWLDFSGDQAGTITDFATIVEALAGTSSSGLDTLAQLTPPADAQEYHDELVLVVQRRRDLAAEILAGDDEQVPSVDALIELRDLETDALETAQLPLLQRVFEARGDEATASFLAQVIDIRENSGAREEELVSVGAGVDGPEEAAEAIEEMLDILAGVVERWERVEAPPAAQGLVDRSVQIAEDYAAYFQGFVDAYRSEDQSGLDDALERSAAISVESARLRADWARFLFEALRDGGSAGGP